MIRILEIVQCSLIWWFFSVDTGSDSEESRRETVIQTKTKVEPKQKPSKIFKLIPSNTPSPKSNKPTNLLSTTKSSKDAKNNSTNIPQESKSELNFAKEEIQMLKLMVHRLNKELAKHNCKDDIIAKDVTEGNDEVDQDLSNDLLKLGPLIVAYDEELCEKDEIIAEYEKQLYHLKIQ